jgi:hypothetical protein
LAGGTDPHWISADSNCRFSNILKHKKMNTFLKTMFWLGFFALLFGIGIGAYTSVEAYKISQDPRVWEGSNGSFLLLVNAAFISGIGTIFLIIGLFFKYKDGWAFAIVLGALYLLSLLYFWLQARGFDPLLLYLSIPGIVCIIAGCLFKLAPFLSRRRTQKHS